MTNANFSGCRGLLATGAVAALLVAGCGGQTTDISAAVDDTNTKLAQDGASIDCPNTVDGGEGTEVECTLKGTDSGKTEKVKIKIGKDAIMPANDADYQAALARVLGQ
jgi:hypothetical protein